MPRGRACLGDARALKAQGMNAMANPTSQDGPLVAVVTPVYNGAAHLEDAILAVQAQTYRPLVHCIVDNASSDATPEIIARFAQSEIRIITARNAETIPFQANFNAVLKLIPPEAGYFRMLHADDTMPPDAIEAMMETVKAANDVVMVSGAERLNGVDRPHYFPKEASVFEANNALARALSDEAHIPCAHALYRVDVLREGEDFYPLSVVECMVEASLRTLSRGGRMGFVHRYNAATTRYEGSGSLIKTLAPKVKANIWEKLTWIERFGPAALSNTEYARVHTRYLRVFYRRILWWFVTGRGDVAMRDLKRLRERGIAPNVMDFLAAVAVWPFYLLAKRTTRKPRPWPADAEKLA
jgi:glycosyltransferase involved in cell wall biosynthesis